MNDELGLGVPSSAPITRSEQKNDLIDQFGRKIDYLRVSVTDRCNFRCRYCMCEEMTFLPRQELLSLDEMDRLCSAFVLRGVRRLRLTGGEPLVRRNVLSLVRSLSRHLESGALDEITLTTNGSLLSRHAAALAETGVKRINISLDTLDPQVFSMVTRRGTLEQVMDGIDAAHAAGLSMKLNAVVMRGVNDHEIERMMQFAHGRGMDLTLIETMPLGAFEGGRDDYYIPLTEIRERLEARYTLRDSADRTAGPAHYVTVAETGGRIGFVTPLSHSFCASCNRVRVTCTGQLTLCLGQELSADLRSPLRSSPEDFLLHQAIDDAIARKPMGHLFNPAQQAHPVISRAMNVTGG